MGKWHWIDFITGGVLGFCLGFLACIWFEVRAHKRTFDHSKRLDEINQMIGQRPRPWKDSEIPQRYGSEYGGER
jgi:hypothetical protein